MSLLFSLLAGAALGVLLLGLLGPVLASPVLARTNYRGDVLPTAGGMVMVVAILAALGIGALSAGTDRPAALLVLLATGYGFLGFVDDVLGAGADGRGFRGHIRAVARGRMTTGLLKLLGGGALAVVACAQVRDAGTLRLLADAAVVALAANLANLFDRAPGRVLKVGLVAGAGLLAAAGLDDELAGVAVVLGAAIALLPGDLHERLMVGDTGANVLGALLGMGVVLTMSPAVRTGVLVVLVALNLASEVVSFSRVIDGVPPLRWVDRFGGRAR